MTDDEIRRWFRDHVGKFDDLGGVQTLDWRKADGSSCYYTGYIIRGQHLFCYGDLGDAIYRWSSGLTFDWIAGLSVDYFASKCEASEVGKAYVEWDYDKALRSVTEQLTCEPGWEDDSNRLSDALDQLGVELEPDFPGLTGKGVLESREDLTSWLHSNDPYDLFGDVWCEWLPTCGDVVAIRCRAHLIGIQMAVRQRQAAVA